MGKKTKTLFLVKPRDLVIAKNNSGIFSDPTEIYNLFAAYNRGHDVYFVHPSDFFVKKGELWGICRKPNAERISNFESFADYIANPRSMFDERLPIKDFNIIFSRIVSKDNRELTNDNNAIIYLRCIKNLYPHITFINDPDSISLAGPKIYDTLVLRGVLPQTHITKDEERIKEIVRRGKEWMAKPIHGLGGKGVVGIKDYEHNLQGIIELLLKDLHSSTNEPRPFILQQKVEGLERRIVLLNGSEILTSYSKIHSEEDNRGNEDSGAISEEYIPSETDKKIISKISSTLMKDGLYLTALDILGPEEDGNLDNTKVLEVNVMCPQWITSSFIASNIEEISDRIIEFSEELNRTQ